MLALNHEQDCDLWAHGLARHIMRDSYTEEELHYALCVSRVQSFHSHGWTELEGKGSFNFGAIAGEGPAGSFNYIIRTFDTHGNPVETASEKLKVYESAAQGFKDLLDKFINPIRDTIRSGGIEAICKAQGWFNPESIIQAYQALTVNIKWKLLLSRHPNLWCVAYEKLNASNNTWIANLEYYRGQRVSEIHRSFRAANPHPDIRVVGISRVIGYKVEDKEGKILSV